MKAQTKLFVKSTALPVSSKVSWRERLPVFEGFRVASDLHLPGQPPVSRCPSQSNKLAEQLQGGDLQGDLAPLSLRPSVAQCPLSLLMNLKGTGRSSGLAVHLPPNILVFIDMERSTLF